MKTKSIIRKEAPVARKVSASHKNTLSFGFSELRDISFIKAKNDATYFIAFLQRLRQYSSLDWNTLYTTQKHGFGTENIEVDSLTDSARRQLTFDIKKLIVLRSKGDNHAFLGFRDNDVFQVVFIEYKFGDIYNH